MMSSDIAYTEAEVAIFRDFMDNRLDPAAEGWGDVIQAQSLSGTGKLASAETHYLSGIENLKLARERLNSEGKDMIVQLLHDFSQDTEQQELPNPDVIFALAAQELEEDIWMAENGLRETRLNREKFGDEIPAEVRYQEVLGWYRATNVRFAVIATVLSILAVAVGAWLFFVFAWLIVIPIALWVSVMFVVFLQWALAGESLLASLDMELREFANRDGWIILPSRSDDETETEDSK